MVTSPYAGVCHFHGYRIHNITWIESSPGGATDWIALSLYNALSLYSIVCFDGWSIGYRYKYD